MEDHVNAFIEDMGAVSTVDGARGLVGQTLADMGFERFAYLGMHLPNTSAAEPVIVHAYAGEWVEHYLDQGYTMVDPVVQTGLRSVVPFFWGGREHRRQLTGQSKQMMDEATEFGISQGFTVPIHGARGELAAMTVALPGPEEKALKRIREFQHRLHLIALHFHANMGEKILAEGASSAVQLSRREIECLLWASQGKTAWETGQILKISENTVREYLKSASRKLGCYSKSHAVVKAIMLGLVRP